MADPIHQFMRPIVLGTPTPQHWEALVGRLRLDNPLLTSSQKKTGEEIFRIAGIYALVRGHLHLIPKPLFQRLCCPSREESSFTNILRNRPSAMGEIEKLHAQQPSQLDLSQMFDNWIRFCRLVGNRPRSLHTGQVIQGVLHGVGFRFSDEQINAAVQPDTKEDWNVLVEELYNYVNFHGHDATLLIDCLETKRLVPHYQVLKNAYLDEADGRETIPEFEAYLAQLAKLYVQQKLDQQSRNLAQNNEPVGQR